VPIKRRERAYYCYIWTYITLDSTPYRVPIRRREGLLLLYMDV